MLTAMTAMSVAPAAMAGVVFQSLSTNATGARSNAYSSGGTYFNSVSTGQRFSIEDDVILDGITFWGSGQNLTGSQLTGFTGYEIIIWNEGFGSIAAQWTIAAADLTSTATGEQNIAGGLEYALRGSIAGTLAAGTYIMNIGAFQSDPNGDAFVWSTGQIEGGWWFTQNPSWGTWVEAPFSISAEPGGAFQLEGTVVPAPGVWALLGLAGRVTRRRRR